MTLEEYLSWETRQEAKHEFIDGRPVAMAGGTFAHGLIAQNVAFALRQRLRGAPCTAMQEERVAVPRGNYRYPDVTVDCGPKSMQDLSAREPTIVFEVDSPSTSALDEIDRLEDLKSVDTIAQIVLLSQTSMRAIVYTRSGAG
jgi:Uma2 family endonuclease